MFVFPPVCHITLSNVSILLPLPLTSGMKLQQIPDLVGSHKMGVTLLPLEFTAEPLSSQSTSTVRER